MAHVRGPFIEYECSSCGVTCQENAPRNHDRLINRIVEANTHAAKRVCAAWDDELLIDWVSVAILRVAEKSATQKRS